MRIFLPCVGVSLVHTCEMRLCSSSSHVCLLALAFSFVFISFHFVCVCVCVYICVARVNQSLTSYESLIGLIMESQVE